MELGHSKKIKLSVEEAEAKVRKALDKQGFGVMTKGDVKKALGKAGIEFEKYVILGACYPKMAHKALQLNKEIGLLLPCNIIIYEKNQETIVSAINSKKAMYIIDISELKEIADFIDEKLKKIIEEL